MRWLGGWRNGLRDGPISLSAIKRTCRSPPPSQPSPSSALRAGWYWMHFCLPSNPIRLPTSFLILTSDVLFWPWAPWPRPAKAVLDSHGSKRSFPGRLQQRPPSSRPYSSTLTPFVFETCFSCLSLLSHAPCTLHSAQFMFRANRVPSFYCVHINYVPFMFKVEFMSSQTILFSLQNMLLATHVPFESDCGQSVCCANYVPFK